MTSQPSTRTGRTPGIRGFRWTWPILVGLVLLGLGWVSASTNLKVSAVRNTLYYKAVKVLGGPIAHSDDPPGVLAGRVLDGDGGPVSGATVLVASPLGNSYTTQSGPDGRFRIPNVPPGTYVPVAAKRGYDLALPRTCLAGLCRKHHATVRPGRETEGIDLILPPGRPPDIVLDDSLVVSPTVAIETTVPLPGQALRTRFSFRRAGKWLDGCYLYEPVEGTGPFPTLLLVLPGPVLAWEIIPVPFAAQGFSVVACYPLRGLDLDQDVADLLTAVEYVRQGRLPSRADPERLGLIGASFTSLHSYRLLGLTDQVDGALVLGGMADGFAFRRDVEEGRVQTRPPFDQALVALGLPNSSPELYFKYSVANHLEGLPPLCLLHGRDDELVPFEQSVMLDGLLTRLGMPHEFHAYEGLSHYFSTSADNATTLQMFRDSLACLRATLEDK